MDLTEFWKQLFYPMENFVVILFSIFMALFTERLMKEFEEAERLGLPNPNNKLYKNILNFVIRFSLSFIIVFLIVYLIILVISIVLALIGLLFFQG